MKRQLSIWVQLVIFLLLLGGSGVLWFGRDHVNEVLAAFTGASREEKEAARRGRTRAVPVVVERVRRSANDVVVEAIAGARAKRFVTLYPEAEGEIVHFGVRAGDRVKEGEVILRLESQAAELAVELGKVKLAEAERLLARSKQLHSRNVNSPARVEDARTVLERMRIELRQAQEALSKRTLRAPFAGVVGIPKVELGDRVKTTTPIITVDDRSSLLVEIAVPEAYIARLALGQKVVGRTPSFPHRRFEGTVERIDSRVDPTSRTVAVRAALPNEGDLLRPGMSFAVELAIAGDAYPTIPELALQWRAGESYVWRVSGGVAQKVRVRSIRRRASMILVEGGLSEGDLVVVEGVHRLRQGRPVRFVAPARAPSS